MSKRIFVSALTALALFLCFIPVSADNSAPVAENFEFETYRGVSFGGQLSALDPDGDILSYEITTQPVKGSIQLGDDGSFVYTPDDGRKGKDYFGYKAVDSEGNCSQEATVIIKLIKQKTAISYADMEGNGSYYSAVALAESGAFIGKQLGGEYYFEPESSITRGEFLTMCLAVSDTEVFSGVVTTGFTDDDEIPAWEKACVSTAVKCGIVKGHREANGVFFDANAEITRAEAMVMLDRTLHLSDVSCVNADGVPAFAAQAAANLSACDVIRSTDAAESSLTRAEAADMLASAMSIMENR